MSLPQLTTNFCGRRIEFSTSRLALKSKFSPRVSLKPPSFPRIDKHLKNESISSDELVEICGASGSGKTYLCMKILSLALLDKETAVIYIDTSNYVNQDNINQLLKVSQNLYLSPFSFCARTTSRLVTKSRRLKWRSRRWDD